MAALLDVGNAQRISAHVKREAWLSLPDIKELAGIMRGEAAPKSSEPSSVHSTTRPATARRRIRRRCSTHWGSPPAVRADARTGRTAEGMGRWSLRTR
jgi:hypothetical protein